MRTRAAVLALAAVLTLPALAGAEPIITYSIAGSSGDWLLDFSVSNTLGLPGMDMYFFGVKLPNRDIVSSPPQWNAETWPEWNNERYGGSTIVYNNVWIDGPPNPWTIQEGETLSGFVARVSTPQRPTRVQWFAYAYGPGLKYPGSDNFHRPDNPGFEGVAQAPVPEPASVLLLGSGLAALAQRYRRRTRAVAAQT